MQVCWWHADDNSDMFACKKLPYFSIIEILGLLYFELVVIFIFYI